MAGLRFFRDRFRAGSRGRGLGGSGAEPSTSVCGTRKAVAHLGHFTGISAAAGRAVRTAAPQEGHVHLLLVMAHRSVRGQEPGSVTSIFR